MVKIIIIKPQGGLSTTEQLLNLIQQHPQGITVKELSQQIKRTISLVNICLKNLVSTKQITVKISGMTRICYPK